MPVIPKECLKSLCELKSQNNDFIVKGSITTITDDYVEVTYAAGVKKMLVTGILVKLCIYNDAQGSKVFMGRIYIGSDTQVRLIEIVTLMAFEKRDFFRINIYQHATMYKKPITIDEIHTTAQTAHEVTINNISLSGIFFLSPLTLAPLTKVYVVLELTSGPHVFECEVSRINNDNPEKTGYGCEFSKMPSRINDALYHYIHVKQLEFIKRERDSSRLL